MPIKLKNLLIDRVDLVGKGDNPEAHIALFKRKPEEEEEEPTWVTKIIDAISKRNRKEGDGNIMFDFQKFVADLKDQDLKTRVSALPADTQKTIGEAVEKTAEESRTAAVLKDLVEKAEMAGEADRLKARIAELEQQLADAKKAAPENPPKEEGEEEEDEDDDNMNDVMKGLPPAIQKLLKDAEDRAAAAETLVKQAQDAQELAKFETVAKSLGTVITAPTKIAPVLKSISEHSAQDYAVIEAVLKAANEILEQNNLMLKEVGSGSTDNTAGGDAWGQIEKAAKELQKADPKLTDAQSIRKAISNNPSLYDQYQKELTEEEV